MTWQAWLFIGLCVFCAGVLLGWFLGGRWTYRQLREDTDDWQHKPTSGPTHAIEDDDWHRRNGW